MFQQARRRQRTNTYGGDDQKEQLYLQPDNAMLTQDINSNEEDYQMDEGNSDDFVDDKKRPRLGDIVLKSFIWILNYMIISKLTLDISRSHPERRLQATVITLFAFVVVFKIVEAGSRSDQTCYVAFLMFILFIMYTNKRV